jgi:signal transduction histidine kinase
MSKTSKKLSRRLSLGITLLAVPIFIGTLGILFLQSRRLIRLEAMERTNSILNKTMLDVRHFMNSIEVSTDANAWLLEENLTSDSIESISRRIMKMNPNILSFSVSTEPEVLPQFGPHFSVYTVRDANTINSYRETEYAYYDKLWYKTALKGEPCWVEPFGEHTEGTIDYHEAVASYCRPLHTADGKIAGVISADFSFSLLAKAINEAEHPYPDMYFILVGKNGRFFIHPDDTKLFRKTIFSDTDPHENTDIIALGHELANGKQGTRHATIDGQFCHVSFRPVPGTDWSLALVCPVSEILTDYNLLAYVVGLIIIIGLMLILWLTQKVVRQTTSPVINLLNITQQITEGNYDETIPYSNEPDTFGKLQNSFAKMQESLHEHMRDIEETTKQLRLHNRKQEDTIDQVESAAKEKESFIRHISHQVRTPLNIIMGYASVIYESVKARHTEPETPNQFEEDNLNEIRAALLNNAVILKRMVLMLYDSSESGASAEKKCKRTSEISCNQIARESISYVKVHNPGVRIRFETTVSDSVFILTNQVYLTRTIRELIYNAVKHSDKKHIQMRVVDTQEQMLFIVEDTGPGLSKDAVQMIEKPFTKMNEESEGLGLGLPLCKRHAMTLGGDLVLDTSYTDGCRFILELPK